MGIGRSTFYDIPDARARDLTIVAEMKTICDEFEAYGYRRVDAELRHRGIVVNAKKIRRLMREHALNPKQRRRFVATTDSDHNYPIFPNLAKNMKLDGPNQLWVADITYVTIATGFVYLAAILDAWSHRRATDGDAPAPGGGGRGTDVNELESATMPCIASAIEGDGVGLRSGSALDVRGRKDYISCLTRSERLGPEVRLVGDRKGNRSEPALAGYQHFGGGSDEPLKPYRSYPAALTARPQRQSSLSDSLGGVERARAWPDHRHGFATSGPQRHWQSWGVVRALPSACSVLRYARSDPAAGSDKYIPSCKD